MDFNINESRWWTKGTALPVEAIFMDGATLYCYSNNKTFKSISSFRTLINIFNSSRVTLVGKFGDWECKLKSYLL